MSGYRLAVLISLLMSTALPLRGGEELGRSSPELGSGDRTVFCELVREPARYDGRRVVTRATLVVMSNSIYLSDPACNSRDNWVKVENIRSFEPSGRLQRILVSSDEGGAQRARGDFAGVLDVLVALGGPWRLGFLLDATSGAEAVSQGEPWPWEAAGASPILDDYEQIDALTASWCLFGLTRGISDAARLHADAEARRIAAQLTDDYVLTSPDGEMRDKATFLADPGAAKTADPEARQCGGSCGEMRYWVRGDAALGVGRIQWKRCSDTSIGTITDPRERVRFTNFFFKRSGKWEQQASHLTSVGTEVPTRETRAGGAWWRRGARSAGGEDVPR